MSMKPGATAQPAASSSRPPRRLGPISRITPPSIATSATPPGAPVPSYNLPPPLTTSAATSSLSVVDHELEQVAIGIAGVDARRAPAPAALARDRPLLDRCVRG